jgi:hypothetical protein
MHGDFINTESWKRGMDKEDELSKLLTENGYEHEKATEDENKKQHIDFHIKKFGRCDVKSMKKFHRDEPVQDKYICIEFQTNEGRLGWVDSETTDCFAFESKDHYSVVKRSELCALARELCNIPTNDKGYVIQSRERKEPYVLYNRGSSGNKDIIGYIKAEDMEHLIIEKVSKSKVKGFDTSWMI